MQLNETGTITTENGTKLTRCESGEWCISRNRKVLGYVSMLAEVEPFLAAEEARLRRRLAIARYKAQDRAADARAERATRR